MKAILITIVMILPCFVFGQIKTDDYIIYSQYLQVYQQEKKTHLNYVIKDSTCYSDESEISDILKNFRSYVKGEKWAESMFIGFYYFRDTLKKDTLWLPLLEQLTHRLHRDIIENKFPKKPHVAIIAYPAYAVYFGGHNSVDNEKGWISFKNDHPRHSYLIDFSEIISDDKRTVFYFTGSRGSLGGEGDLVLFYKVGSEWKFVGIIPLWVS